MRARTSAHCVISTNTQGFLQSFDLLYFTVDVCRVPRSGPARPAAAGPSRPRPQCGQTAGVWERLPAAPLSPGGGKKRDRTH